MINEIAKKIVAAITDRVENDYEEFLGSDVIPTQKWVPCSERLPDIKNRSENYLVTLKNGAVREATCTECSGEHWWDYNYDDVVAWMPMPKPYEIEREKAKQK